jgi:spoIIIJ-associated protein
MKPKEIENLIKELIEKTTISVASIDTNEEDPKNIWFSVEVSEPHYFISREGEGLSALNHLVRRIVEGKSENKNENRTENEEHELRTLIDINGFQKQRVESLKAVAHMMAERARYFKSNVEVDPMSAFERRIVHEFLSNSPDLKTESTGMGKNRRVVIKYIGNISL